MMIRGSVDTVTETAVTGWVYSPGRKAPITVQAILNHEIIGETTANTHRSDLKKAGLGDGNSGFEINLYRLIDPLYIPFVQVTVDGGDVELPRVPTLGFGDFFRSLYAAHPTAGRHRSVFGGLWTDRTDAAAMLEGKIAIGQVTPEAASVILDLIRNGFATIPLAANSVVHVWRENLAENIGDVLEKSLVLSVLRAVLDDNPLVVRTEWFDADATSFDQASIRNPSPSPAEVIEVIIPFGDAVFLEFIRDSHMLPEFNNNGVSRWRKSETTAEVKIDLTNGLLTSRNLVPNEIALVGPGTVGRLRCGDQDDALKLYCIPRRSAPAKDTNPNLAKMQRNSGLTIWPT
jgi:hypothetical protein